MNPSTSIHFRRRWFYVLWSGLLAVSLVAWILWIIPRSRGEAKLTLRLRVKEAPEGMAAQVWSGPAARWNPAGLGFGPESLPGKDGWLSFPLQTIPIARRRWSNLLHPATTDQVVVRFRLPGGGYRFALLDLRLDLNQGFLREGRTQRYEIQFNWRSIKDAEGFPSRIL